MASRLKKRWTSLPKPAFRRWNWAQAPIPAAAIWMMPAAWRSLIHDEGARKKLRKMIEDRGLTLDSLSVHGNPLHPDKAIAEDHHAVFQNAVLLAEKLDIGVVNGFSGCPGDSPRAKNPNWVTCPWPDEYRDILDYQWKKVAIPYWKKQNKFLKEHNVKFAIEAHPGFLVYNPETILKLRDAAGSQIGANFDPSHFWWQGIDPIAAVRALGKENAVFHVHAKDTRIDPYNSAVNGNLDTKSYGDILGRSWVVPLGRLRPHADLVERLCFQSANDRL